MRLSHTYRCPHSDYVRLPPQRGDGDLCAALSTSTRSFKPVNVLRGISNIGTRMLACTCWSRLAHLRLRPRSGERQCRQQGAGETLRVLIVTLAHGDVLSVGTSAYLTWGQAGERPPDCRAAETPRHPVMSGCRGAPVACAARERPVTVARNDDRVRNLAGFTGIGGVRAALVGNPDERSVARPLAASMRSVSGRRSTARGARTGRSAADRREGAIVPTAPQRGDRARLPLSSVQQAGCGKESALYLLSAVGGWRVSIGVGQACQVTGTAGWAVPPDA